MSPFVKTRWLSVIIKSKDFARCMESEGRKGRRKVDYGMFASLGDKTKQKRWKRREGQLQNESVGWTPTTARCQGADSQPASRGEENDPRNEPHPSLAPYSLLVLVRSVIGMWVPCDACRERQRERDKMGEQKNDQ